MSRDLKSLPGGLTASTHPLPGHALVRWKAIQSQLAAAQQPILATWAAYIEGALRSEGVDLDSCNVAVDEGSGTYTVTPRVS